MGNVLSAQIPNQILTVEAYLSDINDVEYVERFFSLLKFLPVVMLITNEILKLNIDFASNHSVRYRLKHTCNKG